MLLKLALLMTGLWVLAVATGAFMHTGAPWYRPRCLSCCWLYRVMSDAHESWTAAACRGHANLLVTPLPERLRHSSDP